MLTFNASGSIGTNISDYTWDFGDGSMGNGVAPTHTYANGTATYPVTLTIAASEGQTASAMTQVTVNNLPPIPMPGGPFTGSVGETIPVTGTCTDPSPADAATCYGTWTDETGAPLDGASFTCPATPGVKTITLTAFDGEGASASASTTVTCNPLPEPLTAVIKIFSCCGYSSMLGFNGSHSFNPNGEIVAYEWDFGDGNTDTGIEVFHTYAQPGSYIVTLTITDDKGAKDSSAVVIP
jgi:PKD repeat protein